MLKKLQLQNLAWTSTSKSWSTLCCVQSLNKSLALGPNVSSQICNKLLPTWSSASTWATVTTSTSFEFASSHLRVTAIKFTKQQLVSQLVSEWVIDKHSQWSDSGPIKMGLAHFLLVIASDCCQFLVSPSYWLFCLLTFDIFYSSQMWPKFHIRWLPIIFISRGCSSSRWIYINTLTICSSQKLVV